MLVYTGATVAGFVDYHEARGKEIPDTWDDATITASMLVASEWIDRIYNRMFIGEKTGGFLQRREWPRINAVIDDARYSHVFGVNEIPEQIIEAVYEAAYRDRVTPGSLLIDYAPNKYKSVDIDGAIAVEYRQFTSSSEAQQSFPVIDQLLYWLIDQCDNRSTYSGGLTRV